MTGRNALGVGDATTSSAKTTQIVLTGTHAGTEHLALGTGRCPQIDHHLDEYTLGNANGAVQGRTNNSVGRVSSPGGP